MKKVVYLTFFIVMKLIDVGCSYAAEDGSNTCTLTVTNVTYTDYNLYDATVEKANRTVKVVL